MLIRWNHQACVKICPTVMKKNRKTLDIKTRALKRIKNLPWLGPLYFYNFTMDGVRLQHMIIHKNIKGYPNVEGFLERDITPTKSDLLLTERLLIAYKKAIADGRKEKNFDAKDMWTFLKKGPHSEFFSLLQNENVRPLAFYLCNMSRMGITHGVTQGKLELDRIRTNAVYRKWFNLFILDSLIRLAEAIGVLTVENPEQGIFGSAIFTNVDEVIEKIEDCLKIKIIPPNVEGGLYKLLTSKGGVHFRDISAIYTSWRCKDLLKGMSDPSLCEIGAGIGKVAYYSWLLGIKDYTIIDLPHINILQGFYLSKSLPSAKITLYGEKVGKGQSISVLPDWTFMKMNSKQFSMTLNQDSLPEISRKAALAYLNQIKKNTKNLFLSINQESKNTMMIGALRQNVVSELVFDAKSYERIYRFPHWMREGYVEELYKIVT